MPRHPCDFELPDTWLAEAGIDGFTAIAAAYRSTAGAVLVPLHDIEPPTRFVAYPKDGHGFDRGRLVSVLAGIVAGAEIEPVSLMALEPAGEFQPFPYCYRVRDGYHRFYASIAAGFTNLPGVVS